MENGLCLFLLAVFFLPASHQTCNITEQKIFILHADYMKPAKVMPVTLCNATDIVKDKPITLEKYEDYLKIEGAFLASQNKEKLPELYANTFSLLPELKSLIITKVELEVLELGAFKNLINLKYLNLRRNRLTSLPPHVFDDVPNLKALNLDLNALETIDEHLFDKLVNLKDLRLLMNQLKVLPGHWHTGLTQLEYLNVAANQFTVLTSEMFHGLVNLDRLRLHSNRLGVIERDAFKGLVKLDSMTLEFNLNISSDLVNELKNLPQLSGIALSPYNFKCEEYLAALDYIEEMKIDLVEIPITSKCWRKEPTTL